MSAVSEVDYFTELSNKPISGFTIVVAVTTKPIPYKNEKGVEVVVPANYRIYVDAAAGVAFYGKDHIEIFEDEYRRVDN